MNTAKFISSVIKGIGIALSGGGIALGAGHLEFVDVDAFTTAAVVVFSILVNIIYQAIKNAQNPKP